MRKIYLLLTWKKIFYSLLLLSLFSLIFANLYVRNVISSLCFFIILYSCIGIFSFEVIIKLLCFGILLKQRIRFLKSDEYQKKLLDCINQSSANGIEFDIPTIAEDYFQLIKKIHLLRKPQQVQLTNKYYLVIIDGKVYDLGKIVRGNDVDGTEKMFEIQVLLSNHLPLKEIEKLLNHLIEMKWENYSKEHKG